LTLTRIGSMSRLTADLTHENAAAIMTVLMQKIDAMRRGGNLAPEEGLVTGADAESPEGRRRSRDRYSHLLAIALTELFTGLLDDNRAGSLHGVAPHVTVTVDAARFAAGLGGDLSMPGSDHPELIPNETVRRILCDCDITTVIVRPSTPADPDAGERPLADLLLEASREVLYVGRTERVVPPRLRRALEVRDRHCQFPGCLAHVRRCNAHHVTKWENGGSTGIDNTVLLCVRHHHAVHEGRWRMARAADVPPGGSGCWVFTPPERRRRP
jgi:hypothetical protein